LHSQRLRHSQTRVKRFGSEPKGSWRVGLGFNVAADGKPSPRKSYHVIDLQEPPKESHGILSFAKMERDFPKTLTVRELLTRASDLLVAQLNDSDFFNLDAADQLSIITGAASELHEECSEQGRFYRNKHLELRANVGYGLVFNGVTKEYRPFDLHSLALNGICREVDSLASHQLNQEQAIQTREELVDPTAGLCVMLEPDDATLEQINRFNTNRLSSTERMAIPLSGQEIDAIFADDIVDAGHEFDV
jgi:hypothetical protein